MKNTSLGGGGIFHTDFKVDLASQWAKGLHFYDVSFFQNREGYEKDSV